MKKILITGITGQLGRALIKRLPETNRPVVCFIRKPEDQYSIDLSGCKVLNADITDRDGLFKHIQKLRGEIDTVVHMATVGLGSLERDLLSTIYRGSINIYDFANEIQCPKFIYFSSIAAAGWVPPGRDYIDESYIPRKRRLCTFGKTKFDTERKLLHLARGSFTKVIVLRPGNIYGPPKLSFIKFVVELLREKKRVFYHRAKKSVMWGPVYIDDVIDCVFKLLNEKSFNNRAYFLTGPEVVTLEDITRVISPLVNVPLRELELDTFGKLHFTARRTYDFIRALIGRPPFPNFVHSNERLQRDFGFIPKVTLAKGLPGTIDWALKKGVL